MNILFVCFSILSPKSRTEKIIGPSIQTTTEFTFHQNALSSQLTKIVRFDSIFYTSCCVICAVWVLFVNRMANSCNYNCFRCVHLFGFVSFDFYLRVFFLPFTLTESLQHIHNQYLLQRAWRFVFILAVRFLWCCSVCIRRHMRFGVMFIHAKAYSSKSAMASV